MGLEVSIQKRFEKFRLNVNFTAEAGTTGLLGASGCGKSMTLKCVAGILTPDEGKITLNGRVLFDSEKKINLSPQQRRVGYLFQNYALFPNMTVAQNIAAGVRARGERRARTAELLAAFQLEALADKAPRQLSGGQQQRVALARILASRPEALLLDEPFSALDSYLKWQVEGELTDRLAAFSGPVVFVTHDRGEVYRLCERVCVLDHGRSQPVQSTQALFSRPATLSACRLSGCENLSRARVLPDGRVEAVDWGLCLAAEGLAPEGARYVAVRARGLSPAGGAGKNVFACRVERVIRELASTVVLLAPEGADAASLRMELDRDAWAALEGRDRLWVGVEPAALMFFSE